MIELPLSVIAWLSVVVVQAVVHYVVLGSRRGRTVAFSSEERHSASLEDCMSLSTVETYEDADASFSLKDTSIGDGPASPILMGEKDLINPEPILELLDQTGTELFQVSEARQ